MNVILREKVGMSQLGGGILYTYNQSDLMRTTNLIVLDGQQRLELWVARYMVE